MSAGLVLVIGLVVTAAILGSPDEDTGLTKSLNHRSSPNLEAASPTNGSGGQICNNMTKTVCTFTTTHCPNKSVSTITNSTLTPFASQSTRFLKQSGDSSEGSGDSSDGTTAQPPSPSPQAATTTPPQTTLTTTPTPTPTTTPTTTPIATETTTTYAEICTESVEKNCTTTIVLHCTTTSTSNSTTTSTTTSTTISTTTSTTTSTSTSTTTSTTTFLFGPWEDTTNCTTSCRLLQTRSCKELSSSASCQNASTERIGETACYEIPCSGKARTFSALGF